MAEDVMRPGRDLCLCPVAAGVAVMYSGVFGSFYRGVQEYRARVLNPKPEVTWRDSAKVDTHVAQDAITNQVRGAFDHVSVSFVDDFQASEALACVFAFWV